MSTGCFDTKIWGNRVYVVKSWSYPLKRLHVSKVHLVSTSDCYHGDPPSLPLDVTWPLPPQVFGFASGGLHWFACTVGLFVRRPVRNQPGPSSPHRWNFNFTPKVSPPSLSCRRRHSEELIFIKRRAGRQKEGAKAKSELIISCVPCLFSFPCRPRGKQPCLGSNVESHYVTNKLQSAEKPPRTHSHTHSLWATRLYFHFVTDTFAKYLFLPVAVGGC